VSRNGEACLWEAGSAFTPSSELEAVADGVTVAGELDCPGSGTLLDVMSDIFLDGFPSQTTLLRLDLPEGYAERSKLDHDTRRGPIDLGEIFQSHEMRPATIASRRSDAAFAELAQRAIDSEVGTWGFIGLLLAVALIGALHALGPGHGKSLMAATLVGSRATMGRVIALGTVMTLTHVADVFFLAIFASAISVLIQPIHLLRWMEIGSAAALVGLGSIGFVRAMLRYRLIRNNVEAADLDEAHRRAHELGMPHAHEQGHEHEGRAHDHDAGHFRQSLWMGFLGSLAPCPSAWAVFMATLAAGRPGVGVALLIAFTIGLHLTIMTVGFLLLASKSYALRKTSPRFTYALPIVSAALIMVLGITLLWRIFI